MNYDDLLPKLLQIAREVMDEESLNFGADTPFDQIHEWDSLNHVHMVVRMEKVFGIRFDDAVRLQSVVKIRDLLELIADIKGIRK